MAPNPQVRVSNGYGDYHNFFAAAAGPRTPFGPVMITPPALNTFNTPNLAVRNTIHHLSTRDSGHSLLAKLYGVHLNRIPLAPRILIWILTCLFFFGLACVALIGVTIIVWGGYMIIEYYVKQHYKGFNWCFNSFLRAITELFDGIKNMGKAAGASCNNGWKKLTARRSTTSSLGNSGNVFNTEWSPTGSVDAAAAAEWGREMDNFDLGARVLGPMVLESGVTISVTDVATGQLLSLDLVINEAPADPVPGEWSGGEIRSPPPVYSVRG